MSMTNVLNIHNRNLVFLAAVHRGDIATVRSMLRSDSYVDPAAQSNAAIFEAAALGDAPMVLCLLQDKRVDPSAQDSRALRTAATMGHDIVVGQLLRDTRVNACVRDNEALRYAAAAGHVSVVSRLLGDARVDPSARNNKALRVAVEYNELNVVRCLLRDKRVDPSALDNVALFDALEQGRVHMAEALLTDERVMLSTGAFDAAKKWPASVYTVGRAMQRLELDRAFAIVTRYPFVTSNERRKSVIVGTFMRVAGIGHMLVQLLLPIRCVMSVVQFLHPLFACLSHHDLLVIVVHCISVRRRVLSKRFSSALTL